MFTEESAKIIPEELEKLIEKGLEVETIVKYGILKSTMDMTVKETAYEIFNLSKEVDCKKSCTNVKKCLLVYKSYAVNHWLFNENAKTIELLDIMFFLNTGKNLPFKKIAFPETVSQYISDWLLNQYDALGLVKKFEGEDVRETKLNDFNQQ